MNFDPRIPVGLMLTIPGMISDKAIYEKSPGININPVWGIVRWSSVS